MTAPTTSEMPPQQPMIGPLSGLPLTGFVPLHVHGEHSKQDSIARVKAIAKWAARNWNGAPGQAAIAMTDHGNMGAAWRFSEACKALGKDGTPVKAIQGIEAYMALVPPAEESETAGSSDPGLAWDDPKVRFARTWRMEPDAESGKVKRNLYNHLTVLARNETGWRNLVAMTNASEESFYRVPLIDYALLKKHGEGLIVLSGCLGGPVASRVASARYVGEDGTVAFDQAILDEARAALDHLIECVGRENVYVEIMEHGLGAEGFEHVQMLMRLAKQAGVQVVATNDSHYVHDHEADAHDSWLVNGEMARNKGAAKKVSKNDPDRWRFNGEGYWMRTEDEMRAVWTGNTGLDAAPAHIREKFLARWQEAVDNTVAIAQRVENEVIPFKALRLPTYPVPADVIAEWEAGAEGVFTDNSGVEHHARILGTKAYRTASDWYLHKLVRDGARERYGVPKEGGGFSLPAEARDRLSFEEGVISTLGLPDYFLIVRDVIAWCRSPLGFPTPEHQHDDTCFVDPETCPVPHKRPILVGPGRGSAAGSAVSYCIGIVQVDPLRWGLLFERFLDIDRVGMPDIDVDFESARRGEVYQYLVAKYGVEYIARIGAFQVAKTKRAIKDAARVLEMVPLGDKLAALVPVHQGSPQHFSTIFEQDLDDDGHKISNPEAADFRDMVDSNLDAARIVELARSFEDVVAGEGIHAAGVIISDEPLTDLIPMRLLRKDGKVVSEVPIALWDGKDIDSFGMLKLDALAIDNLDFLSAAVEHIKRTTGEFVDPDALPDPDDMTNARVAAAYEALRNGRTAGVFQLESQGITELTIQTAPTNFEDVSSILALYRPGPMGANMHTLFADRKNGRAPIDYGIFTDDADEAAVIESVLGDTYGVIVFQEQLMFLAGKVAGFDAIQRSDLRKAVSKKKKSEIDRLKVIFLEQGAIEMTLEDGSHKIAFQKKTLDALWETFNASAAYLFNKSHTVAYGYLSYVTAYFKANFPTEYGAGVLGVSKKKADKRLAAIQALRDEGIEVLPPDVNKSMADTAPDPEQDKAVRIGLTEVRDVGDNGRYIVAEREGSGRPFESLEDLMFRAKVPAQDGTMTGKMPITAVEGLIEAGAFDGLGLPRLGLTIVARAVTPDVRVDVPQAEWSVLERSARQRARLGLAVGEHPMKVYVDEVKTYRFNERRISGTEKTAHGCPVSLGRVAKMSRGDFVTAGVLTQWTERTTRSGSKMANFTIEGSSVTMSGVAFASTLRQIETDNVDLRVGSIVAIGGYVKTKTITNIVLDETSGEEREEEREIRELTANRVEVIAVKEDKILPPPTDHKPIRLAEVLPMARWRAAKIAADKQAAKASVRASAKKAKETATPPAAPEPATSPAADAAPTSHQTVKTVDEEALAVTALAPAPVMANATGWHGVFFCRSGNEFNGQSAALYGDGARLRSLFRLGESNPTARSEYVIRANPHVFRVEGLGCGCEKTCTACFGSAERGSKPARPACIHHAPDGGAPCVCTKDCAEKSHLRGQYVLIVQARTQEEARDLIDKIDPRSPLFSLVDHIEYPGWAQAPLSAFAAQDQREQAPAAPPVPGQRHLRPVA